MNARLSIKGIHHLVTLVVLILIFGLTGRIELLLLAAPFGVVVVAGLLKPDLPQISIERRLSSRRVFESERLEYSLSIRSAAPIALIELLEPLPDDIDIVDGSNHVLTGLQAAGEQSFTCTFTVPTRRSFRLTGVRVRIFGPFGFRTVEFESGEEIAVLVFPSPTPLKSIIRPIHTQVNTGNFPSRASGDGVEFASIREMQSGDRLESVNWRVTARRGTLYVNEFVMERNADIVLFLDTFADQEGSTSSSLDLVTRCAAAVSRHYLQGKNRVGVVEFGHYVSFIPPSSGTRQWYRILGQLSGTHAMTRSVTYDVGVVPKRILPSRALVIAISPFLSGIFDRTLLDLKGRGFDVSVLHVGIETEATDSRDREDEMLRIASDRIWRLELRRRVSRLQASGIAVATWDSSSLDGSLRELNAVRAKRR